MIYPRKNKSDFTEEEIDEIREMPGDEIIGIDEAGDPIYADEFFDDEDEEFEEDEEWDEDDDDEYFDCYLDY